MKFRKLRIAWSVGWGIGCLLLVVLWVRSYWVCDVVFHLDPNAGTTIGASSGIVYFVRLDNLTSSSNTYEAHGWEYVSHKPTEGEVSPRLQFGHLANSAIGIVNIQLPCWLGALSCVVLAVLPWIRWSNRFSLRTLLIVTTLVAVVLGLMVWLV
jgi:hypothetical protein